MRFDGLIRLVTAVQALRSGCVLRGCKPLRLLGSDAGCADQRGVHRVYRRGFRIDADCLPATVCPTK